MKHTRKTLEDLEYDEKARFRAVFIKAGTKTERGGRTVGTRTLTTDHIEKQAKGT